MSGKCKSFAGIFIDKNNKATIPVKRLLNFDPENYNPRKFYNVNYDGVLKKCLVLGIRGSRSAVETEIFSKRVTASPANLIKSASEISDTDHSTKPGNTKKGNKENKSTSANKELLNQILELKEESKKRQATDNNNKIPSKLMRIKNDDEKTSAPQTLQHLSPNEDLGDEGKEKLLRYINLLKQELKIKEQQIKTKDNEIIEKNNTITKLTELNEKLQLQVIDQVTQLIDETKKGLGLQLVQNPKYEIGYFNEMKNNVHIGNNRWMPKNIFDAVMLEKKSSLFVNSVAVFIFGLDTLLKSTITGQKSRRKSTENGHLQKLEEDSLIVMRDFYMYYLEKSPYMTILGKLERDMEFRKLYTYLGRYIASLKKSEAVKKVKEAEREINEEKEEEEEETMNDEIRRVEDEDEDEISEKELLELGIILEGHNIELIKNENEDYEEINDNLVIDENNLILDEFH